VAPSVRVEIEDIYASRREGAGYQSDQNLAILQAAADESVRAHLPERQIAAATNELALTLEQHGRLAKAEAMFRQTLDIYKREPYAICDQGEILHNLGSIRSQRQDIAGSLVYYRQAYESVRQCSGDDSLKTLEIQSYMANALIRVGNPQLVVSMLEDALPKWRKAVGSESSDMATPLLFLTRAYIATGDFVKAEHSAAELIHVLEGKYNPHSSTMGVCQEAWAQALAGQHRYREALVHAQIAVDAFPSNPNPGERANAAKALITLQGIQANLAKPSR
jgi:tetratricopeptide (TPR) repeat protein